MRVLLLLLLPTALLLDGVAGDDFCGFGVAVSGLVFAVDSVVGVVSVLLLLVVGEGVGFGLRFGAPLGVVASFNVEDAFCWGACCCCCCCGWVGCCG